MADRPQCQHYVCVNSKRTAQLLLCTQNAASYGYRCSDFREIGAASLKEKQREALLTFLSGRDTFVVLPTGYDGKSLIYAMLPLVYLAIDSFGVARQPATRTRVAIRRLRDALHLTLRYGLGPVYY